MLRACLLAALSAAVAADPTPPSAASSGSSGRAAASRKHVLFIVGDDVGYSDFGYFNDKKTITPTVDGLLESGIHLVRASPLPAGLRCPPPPGPPLSAVSAWLLRQADYYTFKICSPSRAAMLTGRYP